MKTLGAVIRRVKYLLHPAPAVGVVAPPPGLEDAPTIELRDERPFARGNKMAKSERVKWAIEIEQAGLRRFPYPFATILAVVSDCDLCARPDYEGYRARLVDELGLDFGDSCKLMNRTYYGHNNDGLCIYRYDGAGHPQCELNRNLEHTFGFVEMLREIHLGNVDHHHYFSGSGPRVFFLSEVRSHGAGRWTAAVPPALKDARPGQRVKGKINFAGAKLPVMAIVVQTRLGSLPEATTVRLVPREEHDGEATYRRCRWGDADWRPRFSEGQGEPAIFTAMAEGADTGKLPLAGFVDRVEIAAPANAPGVEIESVLLLNVQRDVLLKTMGEIFGVLQFRTNLLTDHGSRFLIDENSEARHSQANDERSSEPRLSALSCRVRRDGLSYSVLGDDPESYAYLLPELRGDYGVRFINPSGASGELGAHIDLLDVVLPARARDGSTIYVARRTAAELPNPARGTPLDNDQGTRTFPIRLGDLLDRQPDHAGAVYPVYTHLGNINPKSERPDPYYPQPVFEDLQNRVLDVSGDVPADRRIWFTRGTVLYDYALMIRSVAPHVRRPDGNSVEISSWHDAILDRRLPESPAQLHGLTFHVDDRGAGRVSLDGRDIAELARNPADETGRESVTVVGADIRHVLLDEVDVEPTAGGATWTWLEDPAAAAPRFAVRRVRLETDGVHEVVWSPGDVRPAAAQFLSFAVRPDDGVRTAVLIETGGGGRFLFGDPIHVDDPLTARYECAPIEAGRWSLRMAPFYDLDWAEDAAPGGPMPSHRTSKVRLLVEGEAGRAACFDQVEFLRPLTTAHPSRQRSLVIGGQVLGGRPSMKVHLRCDGHRRAVELADPQGFFYFSGVPRGAVGELWVEDVDTGEIRIPRRGRRFTIASNDVTIVVDTEGQASRSAS